MRHLAIYGAVQAIVQMGSFRKAAEVLAISPSALNRQVLALEEELGSPLFDRLPGGVRLSTAGEVYFQQFRDHLAGMERARTRVADLSGLRIGRVAIGVAPELSGGFLPRMIAGYRDEHPAVSFGVQPADDTALGPLLANDRVDLVLAVQTAMPDEAETIAVVERPVVAVMRAAEDESPLPLHALVEHDLILPPAGTGLRAHLSAIFRRRRLMLRPAIETATLDMATLTGARSALQMCLDADLDEGLLRVLGLDLRRFRSRDIGPVRVQLMQRRGRTLPVAAAKFAQMLTAEMER